MDSEALEEKVTPLKLSSDNKKALPEWNQAGRIYAVNGPLKSG